MVGQGQHLLQYGAVGLWALTSTGAVVFLFRKFLEAKQQHLADQMKWSKEQREDYESQQVVLRELGATVSDVAYKADGAHKAAVGAIKRIDALAAASPGINQAVYQAGKGGSG